MSPKRRTPAYLVFVLPLLSLGPFSATASDDPPSGNQTPSKKKEPTPSQTTSKPAPPPQPKAAPKPAGQKVISADKARERRRSEFLQPPGTSRYDDPVDWSQIPEWRQAEFFGIRAQGQFFIYVVDCSGSMDDEDRLSRAKEQVRKSVMRLREPQKFRVIFYNDEPVTAPGEVKSAADLRSKSELFAWMRLIEADGDTDPRPAIAQALSLRPDAVFLLSDGLYPEGTVEAVARKNTRKIPIHCVDLSGGEAGDQLKRIARESGGTYASRP